MPMVLGVLRSDLARPVLPGNASGIARAVSIENGGESLLQSPKVWKLNSVGAARQDQAK
jgi:hypothetical protein